MHLLAVLTQESALAAVPAGLCAHLPAGWRPAAASGGRREGAVLKKSAPAMMCVGFLGAFWGTEQLLDDK